MYGSDKKRVGFLFGVLTGAVLVALGAALVLSRLEGKNALPEELNDARARAGKISSDIVRLSKEANDNIKALGALEPGGDGGQAQGLIEEAKSKNKDAYEKSVALSHELQLMAQVLPRVKSPAAEQVLYRAITVEISLVTEFIQYTKDLNTFLENVSEFLRVKTQESRFRVQSQEQAVNARVERINSLNDEFLKYMEELDKATK